MKKIKTIILITILLFSSQKGFSEIGLGTKFATIVLEKLEPGGVYNIRQLRNLPLVVINSGTSEVDVAVEIERPEKSELQEGYEAIFDPDWIKILPNKFRLKAGESYSCDVIVTPPADKAYYGKHYQAKIWSHTTGEDAFGAGVVNRIFFSIGTAGPESVQKAKKKEFLMSLNFETDPSVIYLNIPAGKKVDVYKELDKSIKLINKGKTELTLKLESVGNRVGEKLISEVPSGYEFTPDLKYLTFKPEIVKMKKNSIKDGKLFLEIPNEEKFYDKNIMFLVKVYPIKPEIPIEFYTKVLVSVTKP